jgi:hypothetical protein
MLKGGAIKYNNAHFSWRTQPKRYRRPYTMDEYDTDVGWVGENIEPAVRRKLRC